jgi:hypothetical protein
VQGPWQGEPTQFGVESAQLASVGGVEIGGMHAAQLVSKIANVACKPHWACRVAIRLDDCLAHEVTAVTG